MDRDVIRLECLKLAANRIPDHQECMLRAKSYEDFVVGQDATPSVTKEKPVNAKPKRLV